MIEKTIKALRDFSIRTKVEQASFKEGDVKKIKFANEEEFQGHLPCGFFEESYEVADVKEIPVIFPIKEEIPSTVSVVQEETPFIQKVAGAPFIHRVVDNEVCTPDEMEDMLVRENSKGKPFKCLKPGCDRLRKKADMYCSVCLKETKNRFNND